MRVEFRAIRLRRLGAVGPELGVAPWGALGEDVVAAGEAPEATSIHVPAGFTVERHDITLHGRCADCVQAGAQAGAKVPA